MLWTQTDHLCRACFGRIYRSDEGGKRLWSCSNCGLKSTVSVRSICVCGSKYKNGKDRGLRCVRNQHRQPGINAEIVVTTVEEMKSGTDAD